jgi:hypothetical protein
MSYVKTIVLMAMVGALLIVAGVHLLLGLGSACVAGGLFLLASAALMTRGLPSRG